MTTLALAGGVALLGFANQPHVQPADEGWHYPLSFQLARGGFPPVSPFGVDAGIGYHYGADLLAASIINVAGVFPWTSFDALSTLLIVALILAVAGFAHDAGAPLPLAVATGAAVGFYEGSVFFGYRTGYFESLALLDPPSSPQRAFTWTFLLQRPMGVVPVVLTAAALQAGPTRRSAGLLAAAAGVQALGDASVMIFATAALALVGAARLVRLRGLERANLATALGVSALLVLFAGGPASDAIFARGGTADDLHVAWEPVADDLLPFQLEEPMLIKIGIVPLVLISGFAARRRRNWGLGFLAVAAACGLLEAELLQSQLYWNEVRIIWLAQAVALLAALAGAGALLTGIQGTRHRRIAAVALGLLVVLPTALPRAVSGTHLALRDLEHADPLADSSGHHYRDRSGVGELIDAHWELLNWLRRHLPNDSRLLTPSTGLVAATTGVGAPFSGGAFQVFDKGNTTWLYSDAMRFLHSDDLSTLGITHLHVTDASASNLDPDAAHRLTDSRYFKLLTDIRTSGSVRHRVYEVMPGAGRTAAAPNSYRALRNRTDLPATVSVLGSLSYRERWATLSAFAGRAALQSSLATGFARGTLSPPIAALEKAPTRGLIILRALVEPTALGASRDEALWQGHGLRAYDLSAAWSSPWRVWSNRAPLPEAQRFICQSAMDGRVDLRLLGEAGAVVKARDTAFTLTGRPQIANLSIRDCDAFTLSTDAVVAPFAQIRPHFAVATVDVAAPTAGLGFDSSAEGDLAILNIWYRNPGNTPFLTGTSFRLYEADASGVSYHQDNANPLHAAVRWWRSPVILRSPEQAARVEFDRRRLTISGDPGGGSANSLERDRTYLLALTVSGSHPSETWEEIQHIIPVARVRLSETGVDYEVFSGIVTIEHRAPGTGH